MERFRVSQIRSVEFIDMCEIKKLFVGFEPWTFRTVVENLLVLLVDNNCDLKLVIIFANEDKILGSLA